MKTEPLTIEKIEEGERLEREATEAPWTGVKTFVENGRAYLCQSPQRLIFAADYNEKIQAGSAKEADADLIAFARNHLADLLASARRELAIREQLTALAAELALCAENTDDERAEQAYRYARDRIDQIAKGKG